MFSPKIALVLLAVTLNSCQSEEVQVGNKRMDSRFLGTFNRYYVSNRETLENGTDYITLQNTAEGVTQLDFLNGAQTIAIVIHGRASSAFSEFGRRLRLSILNSDSNQEIAVIMVDWALVSSLEYATAVNSAEYVADDIIALITQMEAQTKINRNLVHIIGFDLGAHIAGLVSKNPQTRVQRITGLSPAGQSWDAFSRRLSPTDANYVEVIHTDYTGAKAFGIADQIGTVNLYANTGTSQPGCANNQCNHDRAWQLFAASLDMGGHLVALKCDTFADMTRDLCFGGPAVTLGDNLLSKTATGVYRVNTGRVYPYNI